MQKTFCNPSTLFIIHIFHDLVEDPVHILMLLLFLLLKKMLLTFFLLILPTSFTTPEIYSTGTVDITGKQANIKNFSSSLSITLLFSGKDEGSKYSNVVVLYMCENAGRVFLRHLNLIH